MLVLSGCGEEEIETPVSLQVEKAQEVFDTTFVEAQEEKKEKEAKSDLEISTGITVHENLNNTLPPDLQNIKIGAKVRYDFTDLESATGQVTLSAHINGSSDPDISFSLALKGRSIKYNLHTLSQNSTKFLGIEQLLGGVEGVEALQDEFVGKWQEYPLNDENFSEIVTILTNANSEGALKVNSKDEDNAILQAFVANKVLEATSGTKNPDKTYTINLSFLPQNATTFLRDVADIIQAKDKELSIFQPIFENMKLSLSSVINEEMNTFLSFDGQLTLEKELFGEEATDPLVIDINSSEIDGGSKWVLLSKNTEGKEGVQLDFEYQNKE